MLIVIFKCFFVQILILCIFNGVSYNFPRTVTFSNQEIQLLALYIKIKVQLKRICFELFFPMFHLSDLKSMFYGIFDGQDLSIIVHL